ncbi:hypothetical protein [Saccharothrix longispora]|uniref:hypothetical protein n=1 Tax=Saccharothrix longispora TaxID=33920 RepID=UPI0028FD5542|nr:hypothetical protein [Saccharothrix longispora]MBY8847823.1 hypothetical protein [Saccharothrix sp. MB29]MDU0291058.1 hypothetical protein [Saccharothrix longispora]
MCNPRRVEVTATRELAEAWEHEIRRFATRTASATGVARVREPLEAGIGAPTLVMLDRVLAASEEWVADGESYRHDLDGGHITYHADTRELEIVAEGSEDVEVSATAVDTRHGTINETITAVGAGHYYDDGWGGLTEADARRTAGRQAEHALEEHRARLLREAREADERARGDEVAASAGSEAEARLAEQVADRTATLRADARRRLTSIGVRGRQVFHEALALAYRDAILAYARMRGASNVACVERDGVLEIEFEMGA